MRTLRGERGARQLNAVFELPVKESGWIAARAIEKPGATVRFAQTSPVWVKAGADTGIVPEDARFFLEWIDRELRFYQQETGLENAAQKAMLDFFGKARAGFLHTTEGWGLGRVAAEACLGDVDCRSRLGQVAWRRLRARVDGVNNVLDITCNVDVTYVLIFIFRVCNRY
ncbi:MAG: hypothetical protein KIT09_13655 [Bryobacteraceae bacterium]|nr:hypothetical protein [Bryobacteraceae bacterium]